MFVCLFEIRGHLSGHFFKVFFKLAWKKKKTKAVDVYRKTDVLKVISFLVRTADLTLLHSEPRGQQVCLLFS